jgi:hypothetical protein
MDGRRRNRAKKISESAKVSGVSAFEQGETRQKVLP